MKKKEFKAALKKVGVEYKTVKKRANQCSEQRVSFEIVVKYLSTAKDVLNNSFLWCLTPEGSDYWNATHIKLKKLEAGDE